MNNLKNIILINYFREQMKIEALYKLVLDSTKSYYTVRLFGEKSGFQ